MEGRFALKIDYKADCGVFTRNGEFLRMIFLCACIVLYNLVQFAMLI